jgi:small-conductance mechanosensitive channel
MLIDTTSRAQPNESPKALSGCWRSALPSLGWNLAFLVSVTVAAAALKRLELSMTWKVLCIVVPLALGAAFVHSTYDLVRRSDELVRRMYLEALSVVAVGVWVLAFIGPILERTGLIERVDSFYYLLVIGVLFVTGMGLSHRRYGA